MSKTMSINREGRIMWVLQHEEYGVLAVCTTEVRANELREMCGYPDYATNLYKFKVDILVS